MHLSRFLLLGFTTSAWAWQINGYSIYNCKEGLDANKVEGTGCHQLRKPAHGVAANIPKGYQMIAYRGSNCNVAQVGKPAPGGTCLSDHDGIPDNIPSTIITSVKIEKT